MAATYAGVTFENEISGQDGQVNRWSQQATIVRRLIPYANKEDVQDAGRGNHRVTILAFITSSSGVATLQAAQGTTRRTLTNPFGDSVNYANVMLTRVGEPRRLSWAEEWMVELEFEREGT